MHRCRNYVVVFLLNFIPETPKDTNKRAFSVFLDEKTFLVNLSKSSVVKISRGNFLIRPSKSVLPGGLAWGKGPPGHRKLTTVFGWPTYLISRTSRISITTENQAPASASRTKLPTEEKLTSAPSPPPRSGIQHDVPRAVTPADPQGQQRVRHRPDPGPRGEPEGPAWQETPGPPKRRCVVARHWCGPGRWVGGSVEWGHLW